MSPANLVGPGGPAPADAAALRLAVRGFGNVGQALARILAERDAELRARYGLSLVVAAAADAGGTVWSADGLDPAALLAAKASQGSVAALPGMAGDSNRPRAHDAPGLPAALAALQQAGDPADVLVDLSPTDVTTGGDALADTRLALQSGLHVVTANKGPLVAAWAELTELARSRGLGLKYGGATAAALPTAGLAHYELAGSRITRLEGVLNGTSNYILTAMAGGRDYQSALAEAQARGIAERNPRLDVEGYDTAVKLLLLCNSLFGTSLTLADIPRQGITEVTREEAAAARQRGGGLKLVARAWREEGGSGEDGGDGRQGGAVHCEVAVTELPPDHLLAHVDGTEKGIVYHTDLMGRLAVIGGGSGPTPAAASVLRDLVNLARELGLARG